MKIWNGLKMENTIYVSTDLQGISYLEVVANNRDERGIDFKNKISSR